MSINRGLVDVTVYDGEGRTLFALGWISRSAIHSALKKAALLHQYRGAAFYLARNAKGAIIGVGKPSGTGWSRSSF